MQRLLPAFTLSLLLATHAAAQTAPALPASLLKDLASDDFTTRSSAQKTLAQIPVSRREELEKIAAAATDPEVKARLLERVAAMEEETILALPTISLDLKNASLAEAAAALSKAANIPITGRDPNDNSGNPITLSKKDVSFSQLIEAIGAQTPLNLLPSPTGLNLVGPNLAARPQPLPPPKAFGPAVLFPQLSLSGQTLKLTITIIADPRLQTAGFATFNPMAKDDKGNNLAIITAGRAGMGGTGPIGPEDYRRVNYTPWHMTLAAPADPKSTLTLKGNLQIQVATQFARATIDDPQSHLPETKTLAGTTVSLLEFASTNPRSASLRVSVAGPSPDDPAGAAAGRGAVVGTPARFFLLDAAGTQLANFSTATTTAKTIPQPTLDEAKKPLRLEIAVPTQWETVTIPVEFKDLPLPPATKTP